MSNIFYKNKRYFIFIMVFIVLWFLNGMFGVFSIADYDWFWNHQYDSASIVFGDLIVKDIFPEQDKNFFQHFDYVIAKDKNQNEAVVFPQLKASLAYTSQIGLQSIILKPIFQLGTRILFKNDDNKYWKSYRLTQATVALSTAIILALFLTFLAVEFGMFPVTIMGLWMIFTNVWLTGFARNIFWVPGTWFLPFICSAYFIYFDNPKHYKWMYLSVFATIMLKSSMGYEYLTTIMIFTTLPVFYFAIARSWTWYKFLQIFIKISLACILGLFTTLLIHAIMHGGIDHIMQRLYWRTINIEHERSATGNYTILKTLSIYILNANIYYVAFIVSLLLESLFILLRFLGSRFPIIKYSIGPGIPIEPKKYIALCITIILSFLGTISYHVIFMQHSAVHTHMNYVLWFMPFWFFMVLLVFFEIPSSLGKYITLQFFKKKTKE